MGSWTHEETLAYFRNAAKGWVGHPGYEGMYDGFLAAMEEGSLVHYDERSWTFDRAFPVAGIFTHDAWTFQIRSFDPRYFIGGGYTSAFRSQLMGWLDVDKCEIVDSWASREGKCIDCNAHIAVVTYDIRTPNGKEITESSRDACYCQKGGQPHTIVRDQYEGSLNWVLEYAPDSQTREELENAWSHKDWHEFARLMETFMTKVQ